MSYTYTKTIYEDIYVQQIIEILEHLRKTKHRRDLRTII